ncbi:MAG: DUF885 family protein [Parvularculaceae bacterium]
MKLFVAAAAAGLSVWAAAWATPSEDLNRLFDDYWATEMLRESPFSATGSGFPGYDDKVPGVAPADEARRADEAKAFAGRLAAIDRSSLSHDEKVSADLLAFILKQHDMALARFDRWRIPFLADTGFHTNFTYVIGSTSFRTAEDYELHRAAGTRFPAIEQNVENMREGLKDGFTQPKEILPTSCLRSRRW